MIKWHLHLLLFCLWWAQLGAQSASFIGLERPSVERFEKEIAHHEAEQKNKKRKKWLTYGLLGTSVVAIGAWGLFAAFKKSPNPSNEKQPEPTPKKEETGIAFSFKTALKFSFAASLINLFWQATFVSFSYLKNRFGKKDNVVMPLNAFAQRLHGCLWRLDQAAQALNQERENTTLVKHYSKELAETFSLFVRSLEKYCAILLCEIKESNQEEEHLVTYWIQLIDRLFSYCAYVAQGLEDDLNKEAWAGFGEKAFTLLKHLNAMTQGMIAPHLPTPQVQGPRNE